VSPLLYFHFRLL